MLAHTKKALSFFMDQIFATIERVMDYNPPVNADPLLPENSSEASFTTRKSKENPLKRKGMDVLCEDPEPQSEERPGKRRRTEMEENNVNGERIRKDSEASCSYNIRQSKENPLKRKETDVLREDPEPQSEERPGKRRTEKGTEPVKRINPFREAKFIGRYCMLGVLGRGAFGYVYSGFRKTDGKKVALKYIPKRERDISITMPGDTRKLPVEVALMELVCKPPHCPYVIELLEWFESPIYFILVLEWPEPCIDLFKYRKLVSKVPEAQTKMIIRQVIEAACHCRDRGVFHRDIKEGNILLNPRTFEVKLIDFGCGDLFKDTPYIKCLGTYRYIPPEWFLNGNYEAEPFTVWGVGILLYSLLHGESPFLGIEQIINADPYCNDNISAACCSLIKWCLELDPQKRPNLDHMLEHPWFLETP